MKLARVLRAGIALGLSRSPETAHDRRLEWAGIMNSSLETQR